MSTSWCARTPWLKPLCKHCQSGTVCSIAYDNCSTYRLYCVCLLHFLPNEHCSFLILCEHLPDCVHFCHIVAFCCPILSTYDATASSMQLRVTHAMPMHAIKATNTTIIIRRSAPTSPDFHVFIAAASIFLQI